MFTREQFVQQWTANLHTVLKHCGALPCILEVSACTPTIIVVFFSPSAYMSRQYFKFGDERFLPNPCQLII
jgi:hypothetical protein